MSLPAASGASALDAVIVVALIVPAGVFAGVCWIFYRAKKREDEAAKIERD